MDLKRQRFAGFLLRTVHECVEHFVHHAEVIVTFILPFYVHEILVQRGDSSSEEASP